MKNAIRTITALAFAAFLLTTVTAFAGGSSDHAKKYKAVSQGVRVLPAETLRDAGIKEETIESISAKAIFGIPEIPKEDFPELYLYVEGTGDVRLSGTIPVPTPFPAFIFVHRVGCTACPDNLVSVVWTQSTETGYKPPYTKWYRVEETPDTLNWAYAGGFESPGSWEITVVVYNPKYDVFMTELFEVRTEVLDFWDYVCLSGDDVEVTFAVQSLGKIEDGTPVIVDIPGIGSKSATATVFPATPREAEVILSLSSSEYAPIAGQVLPVTVTLPPATSGGAARTRTQDTVFFPTDSSCDEVDGGKG